MMNAGRQLPRGLPGGNLLDRVTLRQLHNKSKDSLLVSHGICYTFAYLSHLPLLHYLFAHEPSFLFSYCMSLNACQFHSAASGGLSIVSVAQRPTVFNSVRGTLACNPFGVCPIAPYYLKCHLLYFVDTFCLDSSSVLFQFFGSTFFRGRQLQIEMPDGLNAFVIFACCLVESPASNHLVW